MFIHAGSENPTYRYWRLRIEGGDSPPDVIPKCCYWESIVFVCGSPTTVLKDDNKSGHSCPDRFPFVTFHSYITSFDGAQDARPLVIL